MTLQELTLRFQSLCHDGYSLAKVKLKAGDEEFKLADVVFLLEMEHLWNPIEVKVDEDAEQR